MFTWYKPQDKLQQIKDKNMFKNYSNKLPGAS